MLSREKSAAILRDNARFIPGGITSTNRATEPPMVFVRGKGARIWDADGNEFIDYHAAFAPHLLGHNDPVVNEAVCRALSDGASLYGAGTTTLEGRLAELIATHVKAAPRVALFNTGSEATYQAIRLARAAKARDHVIVMQGGYNGWHNDVSCNLMTPLGELGQRVSPGEYAFRSISAGVPLVHQSLVHPINFNDLDSVAWVCEKYPVAALITEPVLQNVGVIKPKPGYLEGLRRLADKFGFVLIFDEVKTGFRAAMGGYSGISGVIPDLVTYGKAIANGYPIAVLGGKAELLDLFVHPSPAKRVLLAGTYNGHPVPTAAAIATLERLLEGDGAVHRRLEELGRKMEDGLCLLLKRHGLMATVCRQGSAFCFYFMDHAPVDWHDLANHHAMGKDVELRQGLIERGVYVFPMATKQLSISAAHTDEDVERTLSAFDHELSKVRI
ncbi:MAG: aspartate aminotransferase family protein [Polyangiaceae bacterium]|nr:aspartate aminotransferase family protein [Polyangiaceae bacterium]